MTAIFRARVIGSLNVNIYCRTFHNYLVIIEIIFTQAERHTQ